MNKKRKKAGRPVKPAAERATSRVWVYLTPGERKQLDRYCDENLLSISSLFRKLLKKEGIIVTVGDGTGVVPAAS
jgi:hypothetical protein